MWRSDHDLPLVLIIAGNVLLTLPVVLIFLAFQRYVTAGMTMSGMKA